MLTFKIAYSLKLYTMFLTKVSRNSITHFLFVCLAMSGVEVSAKKFLELNTDLFYDGFKSPGWNITKEVLEEVIQSLFELESLWPNCRSIKRTRQVFGMWVNSSPDILVRWLTLLTPLGKLENERNRSNSQSPNSHILINLLIKFSLKKPIKLLTMPKASNSAKNGKDPQI